LEDRVNPKEGNQELPVLLCISGLVEKGSQELPVLLCISGLVENKLCNTPITGLSGTLEIRGCLPCSKVLPLTPGTAALRARAVRFVGNLVNASVVALPIAAPRLAGFAMISPMVLGLSFVVLMV
jgi:hypothetical protein